MSHRSTKLRAKASRQASRGREPKINYLGDLQRLRLNPRDVLVLSFQGTMSAPMAERITQYFGGFVPNKVVILDDGTKVGVLAMPEIREAAPTWPSPYRTGDSTNGKKGQAR